MTSMHWPNQNFELLSFWAHPNNTQINYWEVVSVIKQKMSRQGPQVYALATPLTSEALIVTAQDQAIATRNIQAKLYYSADSRKCR